MHIYDKGRTLPELSTTDAKLREGAALFYRHGVSYNTPFLSIG